MTNEEAKKAEKELNALLNMCNPSPLTKELEDALKLAIKALEQEPCEDCISRQAVIRLVEQYPNIIGNRCSGLISDIKHLPPVKPTYTDEEIDKAQAVEQAYVDKMVELAVEEIKEQYSDAIGKMKKAIDEMTKIHSDGEFYIKNVDAKWIISKYLCGAKMSGGGEDEVSN